MSNCIYYYDCFLKNCLINWALKQFLYGKCTMFSNDLIHSVSYLIIQYGLHIADANIKLTVSLTAKGQHSEPRKSPNQADGWILIPSGGTAVRETHCEHEQSWLVEYDYRAAAQFEKPCWGHMVLTVLVCLGYHRAYCLA